MTTTIHNVQLLQQQAEAAQQCYEKHLLEYQELVEQTADAVLTASQSWDLSTHEHACPDVSTAQRLEAEHDAIRDRYLDAVRKARNAEKQQAFLPDVHTNPHDYN